MQRLERVDLTPGVTGLLLLARDTVRFHGQQEELFERREAGDDEALGELVDRLAGRLGHRAVMRPRLLDDHQPEFAFRYVTVAEVGCEEWSGAAVGIGDHRQRAGASADAAGCDSGDRTGAGRTANVVYLWRARVFGRAGGRSGASGDSVVAGG